LRCAWIRCVIDREGQREAGAARYFADWLERKWRFASRTIPNAKPYSQSIAIPIAEPNAIADTDAATDAYPDSAAIRRRLSSAGERTP